MHITMTVNNIQLSIVATIYNDAQIVPVLVREINEFVYPLNSTYEIILVNDCSKDDSQLAIEEECKKNKNVKGVLLSRNFGQQIAMSAGMRHASGKYIVIMDGDMQNPPSEIPRLYDKIKEGFDIVYCVSKKRNNLFDEITSSMFWFILINVFGVKIIRDQLMMKIMSRRFVENYNLYNEINRTVTGIMADIGSRFTTIEITNQKRHSGKGNYSFLKRLNLMIDIVISLSSSPLNIMMHLGWIIFLFTASASVYFLYGYFMYNDILPGFTSIMLALFFFGSIIILMLGFIGRYLSNIYSEVRNRPLYIAQKTINFNNE